MTPDAQHSSDIMLLIYDDQPDSWPAVFDKTMPCSEKIKHAKNYLSPRVGVPASYRVVWNHRQSTNVWHMAPMPIYEHARPRFWYLVAANCRGIEDLHYRVQFTNRGSGWDKQFGVNEQGLNTVYIVFFIVYIGLIAVHFHALRSMWSTHYRLHPILQLTASTMLLQCCGMFCSLVHYVSYSDNGAGTPLINAIGQVCVGVARTSFALLLLLLATGWTISTPRMRHRKSVISTVWTLIGTYGILLVWQYFGQDPATELYVYDSFAGTLVMLVDVCIGVWFQQIISETILRENNARKQKLYNILRFSFGFWFFVTPVMFIVCGAFIWPWERERLVTLIALSITLVAHSAMAFLLSPSRAKEYFQLDMPDSTTTWVSRYFEEDDYEYGGGGHDDDCGL
jgi:GPR180/TMEM145, transmembrane domain